MQFSPTIWNLHERVLTNTDRTNNHAKAANRQLNQLMTNKHTIWAFINTLQKIQAATDKQYAHLITGNSPRKKLKKFRDTDKRILNYSIDTIKMTFPNLLREYLII